MKKEEFIYLKEEEKVKIPSQANSMNVVIRKCVVNEVDGKWDELKMGEICPFIETWTSKEIYLCSYITIKDENGSNLIIKHISHIAFPFLKDLMLDTNGIESIEGMCQMNMPNLADIYICHK